MIKAKLLRELFEKPGIIRIAGAHDGLGGKIVEQNRFDGIWASGFEISSSYSVPDASILTMTQFLERAIEINNATSIPVIADCDTGFGNSINVIHMVKNYEAAGIAAVCIEDKKFPKINSLLIGGRQELAPIAEFIGKIMAAKNAQQTKEFMVFARVEALVAGWGQEEALKRAHAYVEAGADAILVQSKSNSPQPIIEFAKAWDNSLPLVIVPTTYPSIKLEQIEKLGIKMAIYANHGLRAAVKAMDSVLSEIYKTNSTFGIEDDIASLREIFELQGMPQLKKDEELYLGAGSEPVKAIIPAAGTPRNQKSLEFLLQDRPVSMLDINGKSLLLRNVETLNSIGIGDIIVITGYQNEKVDLDGIETIFNKNYRDKHILHSIMLAEENIDSRILLAYSDILFEKNLLERLLQCESEITLVVDASYKKTGLRNKKLDLVITKNKPILGKRTLIYNKLNPILKIGTNIPEEKACYEFIGMALFSEKGAMKFKDNYHKAMAKYKTSRFHEAASFSQASFKDMIQELIDNGQTVHALEVNSGWMEIHTFDDYKHACLLSSSK